MSALYHLMGILIKKDTKLNICGQEVGLRGTARHVLIAKLYNVIIMAKSNNLGMEYYLSNYFLQDKKLQNIY